MTYLQRIGQILLLIPLVSTLSVQCLWAQKTVKAPAYEGTNIVGPDFVADATSGPPLRINSTTLVTNLNADFVNGLHASAFAQLGAANTFTANQTFVSNVGIGFTGASPEPLHVLRDGAGPTAVIEQAQVGQDSAIDFHRQAGWWGMWASSSPTATHEFFSGRTATALAPFQSH
jgi:hypothetical protein